jgi:hypothetical protein
MLTKNKIPVLILLIFCIEVLIYLWAQWTASLDKNDFFAITPEFIFDKCARNSGRVSSLINLIILLMIGYFGLNKIYLDDKSKDAFRILMTLFAINHLIHFLFVFQTFQYHSLPLSILDQKHGFVTFIGLLLIPILLWCSKNLNKVLYMATILNLLNVSYFIMETFYNKIKPLKPAYHNQLGIIVTTAACIYMLYSIFREYKINSARLR